MDQKSAAFFTSVKNTFIQSDTRLVERVGIFTEREREREA